MPHLAKAVEINRSFDQLKTQYMAVLSVLDRVQIGICIALPSGEVIVVNQEAQRIFDLDDGLLMAPNKYIVCSNPEATNTLTRAIQMARKMFPRPYLPYPDDPSPSPFWSRLLLFVIALKNWRSGLRARW